MDTSEWILVALVAAIVIGFILHLKRQSSSASNAESVKAHVTDALGSAVTAFHNATVGAIATVAAVASKPAEAGPAPAQAPPAAAAVSAPQPSSPSAPAAAAEAPAVAASEPAPPAPAPAPAAGVVPRVEETAVAFGLRNGLNVGPWVQFTSTMPGNMTWAEMLPLFRLWHAPAPSASSNGGDLDPLNGENLCRMVVAYASGEQDRDQTLKANLGAMWAPYVNAYETGAGPLGADIAVLRTTDGAAAWNLAASQRDTPTSPNATAAVQRLLDLHAIKGGGSLAGFTGA